MRSSGSRVVRSTHSERMCCVKLNPLRPALASEAITDIRVVTGYAMNVRGEAPTQTVPADQSTIAVAPS